MSKLSLLAVLLAAAPAAAQVGSWSRLEGQRSGIQDRRLVVVQDQAAWEALWKEHAAGEPAPAVDFARESVVVVALGETPRAGVRVEVVVQQDSLDRGRLNVLYREVGPKGGWGATVITYPYAIVKVHKAATVHFEVNGRVSVPEKGARPANPADSTKFRALIDSLENPGFDGR